VQDGDKSINDGHHHGGGGTVGDPHGHKRGRHHEAKQDHVG